MTIGKYISILLISSFFLFGIFSGPGCANIVPPGGGPRDSLPPMLVSALPKDSALKVDQQKVVITFNEFVELKNTSEQVLISPYPAKQPTIESKLRTVIVRLKDSLLPNTTYSIDFGDAITDLNEGNVLRNFRYIFSTGAQIDSNELTGKVVLAETGQTDSTMFAVLYSKQEDSTVAKETPKYVARVNSKGIFTFTNLPAGTFYVYALLDMDGNKKYNQPIEQFAFLDSPVVVNADTKPVLLNAFAVEKEKPKAPPTVPAKGNSIRTLLSTNNLEAGSQDFLDSFKLSYLKPLRRFDSTKILLFLDSTKQVNNLVIKNDTINKKLIIYTPWKQGSNYLIYLNKEYAVDTSGLAAVKNDTIAFRIKTEKEYGSVRIRFKELDTSKHPVLLFYSNGEIVGSYPIISKEWYRKLFKPGTYQLGILYDTNQNGVWDAGEFFAKKKRQPELVQPISNPLTVKGNWDNELTIDLAQQKTGAETKQIESTPPGRNF